MATLEQILEERIAEIDVKSIVKDEVRRQVSDDVRRKIRDCVSEKVSEMIKTEFEIQMKKPVQTDDGWGKRETYKTFEDLFRQKFVEKMNNTYEVKREIEKYVSASVNALFKESYKDVVQKVATEMLKK
jgi:flagellar motor switch protein FliG